GCNSAFKSPNGSNANPCPVNLEAGMDLDAQVLGIEEVQGMAYPNPATDYLNLFVGGQEGQIDVQVFDVSGRMLIAKDFGVTGLQEVQLDISPLEPGIYIVKVGSDSAFRIIKQ
ncbi:MAG TPA: T9SS type A sorting domain-containing protein, partial [Robiginitalea sp.]|nr:T9SS type A sorting domain-containing protein [Robiginitalea sp.]